MWAFLFDYECDDSGYRSIWLLYNMFFLRSFMLDSSVTPSLQAKIATNL